MANQPTKTSRQQGHFKKGQSGNPNGRPRGSTGHNAELRRHEDDALKLAANTADVIAATARMALIEIDQQELVPLFDAITNAAKLAVKGGEIGPSSIAILCTGFDNFEGDDRKKNFFVHIGLPDNCDWPTFEKYYRTRGRIDFDRFVDDYATFPPIARRIAELTQQRLFAPVNDAPSKKLEIGFD